MSESPLLPEQVPDQGCPELPPEPCAPPGSQSLLLLAALLHPLRGGRRRRQVWRWRLLQVTSSPFLRHNRFKSVSCNLWYCGTLLFLRLECLNSERSFASGIHSRGKAADGSLRSHQASRRRRMRVSSSNRWWPWLLTASRRRAEQGKRQSGKKMRGGMLCSQVLLIRFVRK